jgi:hypothetical protein
MKIDKEKLKALVEKPDDELWREIVAIAASHGFKLPEKTPSHTEMEKMRAAVSNGAKLNLAEAIRVINNYRRGAK